LSKNDIQSGSGSKKFSKNPDPGLRKSGSGTTLICSMLRRYALMPSTARLVTFDRFY